MRFTCPMSYVRALWLSIGGSGRRCCKISANPICTKYQNQYSVIHISFNDLPKRCTSYEKYIDRIENRLIKDLRLEYPDVEISEDEAVWDVLNEIYAYDINARFIFVFDEWDFIFHQDFITEQDKKDYLLFLRNLLTICIACIYYRNSSNRKIFKRFRT